MKNKFLIAIVLSFALASISLSLATSIYTYQQQKNLFLTNTSISNVDISLLSKEEALNKIKKDLENKPDFFQIEIASGETKLASSSDHLNFKLEIEQTLDQVFKETHQQFNPTNPFKFFSLLKEDKDFELISSFDEAKVQEMIDLFKSQIDEPGHEPFATLKWGSVSIDPGLEGLEINSEENLKVLTNKISENTDLSPINLEITPQKTYFQLSEEESKIAQKRAENFIDKTIILENTDHKGTYFRLKDNDLISLLSFPEGFSQEKLQNKVTEISEQIKKDPQNAEFEYREENEKIIVDKFVPHQYGLEINQTQTFFALNEWITSADNHFKTQQLQELSSQTNDETQLSEKEIVLDQEIPEKTALKLELISTPPDIILEQTNDLGIKEMIGFGDSEYDHSIPNRIHNVSVATKKISGFIIAPDEEFRFNDALGEVSRRTGYKSAYVISGGKTVLGDGGGVCQVSTTTFRSALDAGLPITKRKAHSYRVSYYELNQKPGIDATVHSGEVDLRFVNDTGHHILITGEAYPDDLYMKIEMYGTSDGRTTEIVDHKTWDYRSPPPPAYYDTTDLAPGVIQQIDWAVAGIKASFTNIVKDSNGEIIREEEYYSNYVPWSAKYLRGI